MPTALSNIPVLKPARHWKPSPYKRKLSHTFVPHSSLNNARLRHRSQDAPLNPNHGYRPFLTCIKGVSTTDLCYVANPVDNRHAWQCSSPGGTDHKFPMSKTHDWWEVLCQRALGPLHSLGYKGSSLTATLHHYTCIETGNHQDQIGGSGVTHPQTHSSKYVFLLSISFSKGHCPVSRWLNRATPLPPTILGMAGLRAVTRTGNRAARVSYYKV